MINPFNRFYDTKISVYEGGGDGYGEGGDRTFLGTVVCDIQPCDDDTERKAYGLAEQRAYKIFCDGSDLIVNGAYVNFGGAWYMIVRAEKWSFGMTAVMRGL